MAAKPGLASAARPAATTIRISGSIPTTPTLFFSSAIRARSSPSTAEPSWSSWYNQPTAQIYHVSVAPTFPYRVCGGQQESGSVCISSRGNDGAITFRDWHPVGVIEYGYVAPDPLDPDIIYGGGRSEVSKFHWSTGQVQNVTPIPLRNPEIPHRPHRAHDVLAHRPARSLFRQQRALQNHRRRKLLADHQSRSHSRESRSPSQRRHVSSPKAPRNSAASSTLSRLHSRTSIRCGRAPTTA